MAARSFTVFLDVPVPSEPSASESKLARSASGILAARSGSQVNVVSQPDSKATIDKENYNPATGERTTATTVADKKRKTVLATKLHVPPAASTSKKEKAKASQAQPEPKKRKTAAAGTKKTKPAATAKKDAKSTSSARKPKRSTPSRRVSPMPKVVEEPSNPEREQVELDQAAIDSRCRDLTVRPLADVTDAYEEAATSASSERRNESKGPFQMIKEASLEPEIRDYFAPPQATSSLASSQHTLFEDDGAPPSHVFSTPERKKIYSAFTFSSPSPSGKRFRELVFRSGSPTPFSTTAVTSPAASTAADLCS